MHPVKHAFILLVVLLLGPSALSSEAGTTGKPNVLVIYSDDHGWADLGAHGVDKHIRTPHLDQLAKDGVRFTRGYVSAPQCMPSRCGVMTGRYQQRFGVEDNNKGPLPLSELTIAERLKPAGYVSGFVGKSHLDIGGGKGESKASRVLLDHLPQHQGFEEFFRGELRQFYASHDLQGNRFADAPRLVTDNRFRVVVQTEAALSFLDRRAANPEQPWFLYLAWYAPHVPLESPEPWFSKTSEQLPLKRRQALAMVAAMDDGLGQIREKLRTMGVDKNTLIFFIADNGAPLGGAWNGSLNLPMVGQKGMLSEGGIRVPFIGAWPSRWPAGATYEHPVISLDVAATATAAAGLPHDAKLDGVDLTPFVTGENSAAPHDALYWRWGSQAAILEMPYKLIALGDRERLLFNLTEPDGEGMRHNLIGQRPEIAARLEKKLRAWAAGLVPPGLPTALDAHHEGLFAEHEIIKAAPTEKPRSKAAPEDSLHGWIARNGTLAIKDGSLLVTPDSDGPKSARLFLARSGLDVAGPVTISMRVRAKQGGKSAFTWRTKADKDFSAANTVAFDWPTSAEWQEVRAEIPVRDRLLHLRITPAKDCTGLEVERIVLEGEGGNSVTFRFDAE
jgi:uncharacterized sulfatase